MRLVKESYRQLHNSILDYILNRMDDSIERDNFIKYLDKHAQFAKRTHKQEIEKAFNMGKLNNGKTFYKIFFEK